MKGKRLLAGALLASMTLSMVACSSGDSTSGDSTSTSTSTTTNTDAVDTNPYGLKGDGAYSCSDEPLTLTAFVHNTGSHVLTQDMPVEQEMARYTNVMINGTSNPYNVDYASEFNLMLTGTTLPDMVSGEMVDLMRIGGEGALIPLQDLIEEYAPNIKATFEKYPEAQASVTDENGDIFVIPFIYEENVSRTWWIRQDWLDAVGLDIPTTIDELEVVMTAFRDEDPDGNGLNDQVVFFQRSPEMSGIEALLQIFDVSPFFNLSDDNTVQHGMYTEEFKYAMQRIGEWYTEGFIHSEIFAEDKTVRDTLFASNNGGITHDWIASTSAYNDSMKDYVEGFNVVGMSPVEDIEGDVWTGFARTRTDEYGWGISVDNEHVIESIKFMDFLFSDIGRDITGFGIEGETYYYDEDGKPQFTDEMLNGEVSALDRIKEMGGGYKTMAYLHDMETEFQVMDESGVAIFETYSDNGYTSVKNVQVPALSFTSEEADLISSKNPTCDAYMKEKAQQWTYDPSLIEKEFDEYMETLSKMGMDEILAAYNAAYNRMMESLG